MKKPRDYSVRKDSATSSQAPESTLNCLLRLVAEDRAESGSFADASPVTVRAMQGKTTHPMEARR